MPLSPLHAFCGSWAALLHRNPFRLTLSRPDGSSSVLIFLDLSITLTFSTCWTAREHVFSVFSLWTPFSISVLYLRQGRVLSFWSLSHSSDNSSPSVLLWLLTELLSWSPHLLCWCSVFHQKLNMAKQRSALPLKLCCSLTSPFLLWQPCCPVPPGLPFRLSSAWNHPLNPINFSFIGSLEFVPASPVPLSPSKN